MRYLVILLALLVAPLAHASPTDPRSIVVDYECNHIDSAKTGFSCQHDMKRGGIILTLHKKTSDMSPSEKEYSQYEFNKIVFRYFQLGGRGFVVHADFWPKNSERVCSRVNATYGYGCGNIFTPTKH